MDLCAKKPIGSRFFTSGTSRRLLTGAVVIAGVAGVVAMAVARTTRLEPLGPLAIGPGWTMRSVGTVDAVAANRSELYVAAGDYDHATLSAIDVPTGKLVHRISLPGLPVALRAGSGGSVWLTFQAVGGQSGLWWLNADLRQRASVATSQANALDLSDVLPIGPFDAVVAGRGLVDVHRRAGGLTLHQIASLPTGRGFSDLVVVESVVRLGDRYAVLESSNSAKYRIAEADRNGAVWPAWKYGPALIGLAPGPNPGIAIDSMARSDRSFWIIVGIDGSPAGDVIRLDDHLREATPSAIRSSNALAYAEQVWTAGRAVVVSTMVATHPLECFSDLNGPGPVTEIPARLPPSDVAIVGDTIYAADAFGLTVYHLPAACR